MPAHPVHLKRSPTTCLQHLTAYYCGTPNLGFYSMWLVDVTVLVIPDEEQHPPLVSSKVVEPGCRRRPLSRRVARTLSAQDLADLQGQICRVLIPPIGGNLSRGEVNAEK